MVEGGEGGGGWWTEAAGLAAAMRVVATSLVATVGVAASQDGGHLTRQVASSARQSG